jgi:hypothetical protein
MSLKEFRKGTSSMAEFDKRMAGYEQYQKWRSENYYTDNWGNRRVKEGNPYQEYSKWGTFRVDGDRYNDLVKLIQQRDQQAGQAYGMQSQAYRTMNRAEGVTLRQIMGGGSGGRSSSGGGSQVTSLADILLQSFNKSNGNIDPNGLLEQPSAGGSSLFRLMQAQHEKELSKNSLDSRADFEEGWDRVKNLIENREDPYKEYKKQLAVMATMAGNLGNIMSGINKMGIELPQGLTAIVEGTQSIISIITSIMTLVSIISSLTAIKSTPILGWLLAEGGIVGGSRGKHPIHAATGTVVPGSNYSGDMVPAMLNSGELVLNRAQQGNLASQLEGGGMNNLQLEAIVTGEQLRFVLNTNSRRRGMGEYVTSTNV